ncbi:MAG: N-acetyl-gamma-glutamyl-phosphate reductase [Rhodobacteraceae bacterium]|nr:N-acetyl-gamma-glutamyl-phosphate reductase [Paracoccaceae bacterium]
MRYVSIIGASGYTGVELVRLVTGHPDFSLRSLVAGQNAGKAYSEIYPAYRYLPLPEMIDMKAFDPSESDLAFCALPHGTSQQIIATLAGRCKIVDLSADFRLDNPAHYEQWYGLEHAAPELQKHAVYGLTEFYRDAIRSADLVACTGCNVAAGLYPLLPLVDRKLIATDRIIVDIKTGVSGAGRSARIAMLHAEISEGCQAYNIESHRHLAEFDQELGKAVGHDVRVTFTPHLVPQNRGILATIYVEGDTGHIHKALEERYLAEPFVTVLPMGQHASTRDVRGTNQVLIGVVPDRIPGRTKLVSVLDNLVKGASGQAVQNANLMLGCDEKSGLDRSALIP